MISWEIMHCCRKLTKYKHESQPQWLCSTKLPTPKRVVSDL